VKSTQNQLICRCLHR